MDNIGIKEIVLTVLPLILLQIAFQVYAILDLFKTKKSKTKNLSAAAWTAIIIIGEIAGPALYFILGRSEE